MSKELDGKMKKLMAKSKREFDAMDKKREEERIKNDPLAGKSPEFRKMVGYAMLGQLFMNSQKDNK